MFHIHRFRKFTDSMNRLHSAGKREIVKIFETRGTCSNPEPGGVTE